MGMIDLAPALRKADTDMTTGSIVKHLLMFAVPLMIGNLFQQLYNTVDSIVVGKFVGKEALAAVGSVTPICNMLIGFFNGFASGAGVIISRYYGAHDSGNVRKSVQTTMAMTYVLSVFLSILGVALVPPLLRMMETPEDVFGQAAEYLRIYFAGLSGLLIYNMGAGILRAVGDSRRPLYFLIFSTVTNTVLDIVLVKTMDHGIAGVALATIISQFASAVLVLVVLTRSRSDYRIRWKETRIDFRILKSICIVGLPSAIQMAVTSFSNVFVQSYINRFESSCMAGWTVCNKLDAFVLLPITSLNLAVTTFVGQNLGAGNPERARKGTYRTFLLAELFCLLLVPLLLLFAPQLVWVFNEDPEVIEFGVFFVRMMAPFYFVVCVNQIFAGSLKGAGDSQSCMFIMLGSFVVFRQIYLFIAYRLTESLVPVALGYPAGWVLCSILIFTYYRAGKWRKKLAQTTKAMNEATK